MSDTKIGVEFSATTAAAVAEVDKLSAAVRETTTAAKGAGKEQQALGREVNATRAAQIEATEATRKAKDAQQLHTLTVAKFGAASAEAAASEARLTKATAEATRAANVAAQSLDKTAKSAQAAAAAEDANLTPATKRAAAQLERMSKDAERTSNDLQKLALQSKAPAGGFDLMGAAGGKLMSVLGPAALGGTLISLAGWLGEAGEKTLQYETAIANLPFSLDGATRATGGLVSQQMLVASASSAVALKVTNTAEEFEALAGASVKLAAKLKQPADALLNNLVTALGRGSTELLDNAGIVLKVADAHERYAISIGKTVAQLTDEEKAGAFKVEAMKAILASAAATEMSYDSNAAAIVRLKVATSDAWEAMQRGAVNATGYLVAAAQENVTSLEAVAKADLAAALAARDLTQEMMRAQEWAPAYKDLAASASEAAVAMAFGKDALAGFGLMYEQGKGILAQEEAKAAILSEEAKYAERMAKAMEKADKANESFLDAQAEHQAFIGPMPLDKPKPKKKGKKKPTDLDLVKGADIRHDESDLINEMYEEDYAREEAQREKVYDLRVAGMEQDLEIIDAIGLAEEDAQQARERLTERRLDAEREFAQQQMRFARTDAQREAATTRMEAVEYQRRLVALRKMAAAEEAEQARKVALTEKITARVTDLGGAMVQAAWDAAEGQKGAGLKALGDYLQTVSKQMAIKALVETALGVSALAGIVTAGLAPGHFAAAGMAAAVAVAAGGAGIGLSAAGDARAESGKAKGRDEAPSGPAGVGQSGPSGSTSDREKRDLSAQEVPISYFDPSKMQGSANMGPTINIDLSGGTWIGAKGPEAAAQEINKILRQGKAAGGR